MKPAPPKIVPKLRKFEQKQCRMDIAEEMLTTFSDDPDLFEKVITGNESGFMAMTLKPKPNHHVAWTSLRRC